MSNLKELSPDLVTLADVFRASGYATGGFTGNAGVSGGFGYEQGFDVYYYPKNVFGSMDESIPRALEWVKANRERKFFLFLHGYDVHGQSTPSQGYDYRFVDPDYDRRYTGSEQEQEALREEGLDRGQVNLREADVRFWRAVYDEKIQRTDEKFRDFLKEYQKIIPPGKTLFVLTSDHGTEFHEHRRFDHGFTLYNELLHVPLILRLPRRIHPLVVDDRISSIDVMPTILDLVGLPMPGSAAEQLRGKSLVPSFQGQSVARDVFSETDYRQYTYKRSIVAPDGWKLIYTLETRTRELYDLNTDPAEQKDLAAAQPQKAEELERRLFAHFRTLGHDLTAKRWETGLNPVYNSQAKDPPKK
jgi:arylsulfatase A-like enzyme